MKIKISYNISLQNLNNYFEINNSQQGAIIRIKRFDISH